MSVEGKTLDTKLLLELEQFIGNTTIYDQKDYGADCIGKLAESMWQMWGFKLPGQSLV